MTEIRTRLHLGDQILVEKAASLLVQRAVDGDHIALSQHLLESVHSAAANFLLYFRLKRLIVKVQELLAVKWLQAPQDSLADSTNSDSAYGLALEIILVLSHLGNIPVTTLDLLMCGDKVADECKNGHDNVLGDGDHIGSRNLGNSDTTIGLVGRIEIDVIGSDTGGDSEFELLGLGETLGSEVAWMEAFKKLVHKLEVRVSGAKIL